MKRMLTKSKTKADILSMLDRISAQHGGAMSIPMLRVDQSDTSNSTPALSPPASCRL